MAAYVRYSVKSLSLLVTDVCRSSPVVDVPSVCLFGLAAAIPMLFHRSKRMTLIRETRLYRKMRLDAPEHSYCVPAERRVSPEFHVHMGLDSNFSIARTPAR